MTQPSEQGIPRGREILRLTYKDQQTILPVVRSNFELKEEARTRIIPGLNKLIAVKDTDAETGIAFIPYHYATDDLMFQDPNAAKALIEALRSAGYQIREDIMENPIKTDPILPTRRNLVSRLKK